MWHKNAIFYGVDVKVFFDGNNDGVGDFVGLTQKLDYLYNLGITAIWVLPFFPSSQRDNGYDITDYYSIDSHFGSLKDFKTFVKEAKKRGIRVIIDLVVHHTSMEHPWFLKAAKNKKSKYYNYYIWTKKIPEKLPDNAKPAFPGVEPGVWKYHPEAKEFYYHWFYRYQPNLNIANPQVQKEIYKIVDFWLTTGICGFRVDAATQMFEVKGIAGTEVKNPEKFMEDLTKHVHKKNPEAILLAEADVEASQVQLFFGTGGRMQLLYDFLLNRYIFLSLAKKESSYMQKCLESLPLPPADSQWMNFLRNLDEVNLEQLKPDEKEVTFKVFGPEQNMQIYNRGIRRRLAPMLSGDMRRLKMAFSLLFCLPGAIMIPYGDEFGIGDNLALPERDSVRTVMQWSSDTNAGFSKSHPSALYRDVIKEGPYRYQKINVKDQISDESSLFYAIKDMIAFRKQHEEIGEGAYKLLHCSKKEVFVISYTYKENTLIILSNLCNDGMVVGLDEFKHATLQEIYSDGVYNKVEKADTITIHGYGFRWFLVKTS